MAGIRYRTWLLIQDTPNKTFREELVSWGVGIGHVSLDERLRISLAARNETAVIQTDDPDRLNRKLFDAHERKQKLEAFSFAPPEELRRIHKRHFFIGRSRLVRVEWAGAHSSPENPYYRRFVTLEYVGAFNPGSPENSEKTEFIKCAADPGRLLVLDPQLIHFKDNDYDLPSVNGCRPLKNYNVLLLPPVREKAASETYFGENKRLLRKKLDNFFRQRNTDHVPASLSLWRVVDDPLLRDILLDGGHVKVVEDSDHRTSLMLAFFARERSRTTGADWWRMAQFLGFDEDPNPPWARNLRDVLLRDLHDLCSRLVVSPKPSDEPVPWDSLPSKIRIDTGGPKYGTWQDFERLRNLLGDKWAADRLNQFVLGPSASLLREKPVYDHDLAERHFNASVFRCPWVFEADPVWREVIVSLVQELMPKERNTADAIDEGVPERDEGMILTPAERAERWLGHQWTEDEQLGFGQLDYPVSTHPEDVERLRLLYPLGTRFSGRLEKVMTLDTTLGKLDSGYCLA